MVDFGFGRDRFGFVVLECRDFFRRRRRFWRLRFGLFVPQPLGWIDGFSIVDGGLSRHRNSGRWAAYEFYIDATIDTADVTPLRARQVEIDRDSDPEDEKDVKNQGKDEEFSKS